MRIYWVSRHELSPAQLQAIKELHGHDAEIIHDPVEFGRFDELAGYIDCRPAGFVYVVAGGPHYIHAALSSRCFGIFENHSKKRADGMLGLRAVYHVKSGKIRKVWENINPESDEGEIVV